MSQKIHVVGAGIISAIGHSWSETLRAFKHNNSGISALTLFNSKHKGVLPVGEVKLTNDELAYLTGAKSNLTRTALLGIHAAKEAYLHSGIHDINKWRTGFISATTVGGMDKTENFFREFVYNVAKGKLRDVVDHACGRSTEIIADSIGVNGLITTINTACSSSVNSLMYASRLIKHNQVDIAFAGGADALTKFTLNGFNSLMILDREPCRPFDATRNGLNLGEGAGFVVLVSDRVKEEENLKSLATISGYANTNDAYHQTASSPEGRGSYAAMQQALWMANLQPENISYINLHGTGTVNNDLSEGTAIKRLFEKNVPKLSSTKSFTGHTLGACGGIESVFSLMSLKHQCVFPNLRFQFIMPEIGLVPQQEFENTQVEHVMSNSFGFGGNCSSIIFSKEKE